MTVFSKQIIWTAVVLAAASGLTNSLQANPQSVYRRALPSIMTLEVENQAGDRFVASGFVALADDTVLTAWHVVSDARAVRAIFADGSKVDVIGFVDREVARDLVLLKLERRLAGRKATLNSTPQTVGTRAFAIGTPKGFGFSLSEGLVSQVRENNGFSQYQVSCPISPGNSGGPVLDDRGRVIAIVSWTKADAQNLSFAVPIQDASRLDSSRAVTRWGQDAGNRPDVKSSRREASTSVRGSSLPLPVAMSLQDLTARLAESTGKKVKIVVEEDGRAPSEFQFVVPSLDDPKNSAAKRP